MIIYLVLPYIFSGDNNQPISNVIFNPIIMANPTEPSTVYTTLKRLKEAANLLGQAHIPVTFDMGLLTKALEITWANPDELKGIIPCDGGMHLLMSVISAVGNIYGDAGLRGLLSESGVFAAGTTQQMLTGKDFSRGIYGLKIVDEILNGRFLQSFNNWCEQTDKTLPERLQPALVELHHAFAAGDVSTTTDKIISELLAILQNHLTALISMFREEGRKSSPSFRFWDDFLHRVMRPFKLFIAATRNGSWSVSQSAKAEFLPLLFAANRNNYARYIPVLLLQMKRLPQDVLTEFADGKFVSKATSGRFNGVWMDYAIETTENKALKGQGGIIGLTLKGPALVRWFLARPITAKYAEIIENDHDNVEQNPPKLHKDAGKAATKRWNSDAEKMNNMFDGSFIDPFDLSNSPEHLVDFSTGIVASSQVEESMLGALDTGLSMSIKFVSERLIVPDGEQKPAKSLYAPLSRSCIKTMANMRKTVKVKQKTIFINGEIMYLRLLAINATKMVPLQRVMAFENAPVPQSIFLEDGSMVSCVKSDFMHKLEGLMPNDKITSIDSCDAIVYDGHASIQMLGTSSTTSVKNTFDDMAQYFTRYIFQHSRSISSEEIQQIHIIFDKYISSSTKSQTRESRGARHTNVNIHIQPNGLIPQNWKQFLSSGVNKQNLAAFYSNYLTTNAAQYLNADQSLYTSGALEDIAIKIQSGYHTEIANLASNQEEADTRIILHVIAAADAGAKCIVVCSPDTDVLVLLIHHRPLIKAQKIYMLTGRTGKYAKLIRYIPVHVIYDVLTRPQHNVLLSIYCLTGCDTVSAFHGHGKKTAFKILMNRAESFQELASLGDGMQASDSVQRSAQTFVAAMYGSTLESLNDVRCVMACKKVTGKKLPPTENSFAQHLLRCIYQLMTWRKANIAMHAYLSPTMFGYERDGDTKLLQAVMMTQEPAAPELLNDLVCQNQMSRCVSTISKHL